MILKNSTYLILLLVFPLLIWIGDRRRKGISFPVFYISLVTPSWRVKAWKARRYLRLTALLLIIMALCRPQSLPVVEKVEVEGGDVMLVLDISTSMLAEDFDGESRIEAAKSVIKRFIEEHRPTRVGLVLFARHAFPACPLTYDHGALLRLIERVKVGLLEDGTAIGSAILSAVRRLKGFKSLGKAVILLTDGENNWGIDPIEAAKTASALRVKIYAIGVGSPSGAPVPVTHPIFGRTYARDEDGKIIIARLDERTLRQIARITGGAYFRAADIEGLNRAYSEIARMERSRFERTITIRRELFGYFLLGALAILLGEMILFHTVLAKIP
jgi:Ca-activated chloride channel family protein